MARAREFDRGEVLDRAMQLFWEHGFSETSIQMLVSRMEVCRSSLYDTFESKEALYREAIDLYVSRSLTQIEELLHATPSPRRSIEQLFETELAALLERENPTCLLLRTAIGRCRDCPETSEKVRSWLAQMVQLFEARLEAARAAEELLPDFDVRAAAHSLVNALLGLKAQGGVPVDRAALELTARSALSLLS